MDDFIQIEGISKKYDNKYVIKDVSMSIPSGRMADQRFEQHVYNY